jgi:hypothetical protein
MESSNQLEILRSIVNYLENRKPDPGPETTTPTRGFVLSERQSAINIEIMRRFRIQNKKLMEQVTLLKDQLKYANKSQEKKKQDMKTLLAFNAELSKAVGSCADCWGEDPSCSNCAGYGAPGWKPASEEHFKAVVIPLLKILFPAETTKKATK